MDIGSIFLILALAVVVVLILSWPFQRKISTQADSTGTTESSSEQKRSALLAARDQALDALQELDFDYNLGKIPAEDYPVQRASLMKEGADVLRQLDELEGTSAAGDAEDRLEADIASRRVDGRAAPALSQSDDDDLEKVIAARRRARQAKTTGFCPKCGKPSLASDQFCSRCGTTLEGTR